jgi:hypothetical protein
MIVSHPFPPEARSISVDPGWCLIYEAQWLVWRSRKTTGNILEIGTHLGGTARNLAKENPDKIIYTVDWVTDTPTMQKEQLGDMPTMETAGKLAAGCSNVVQILQNSRDFDYFGKDIGFVFIDGDHSYDGVKADTELALKSHCDEPRHMTIVWHDFYPGEWNGWCGVPKYLNQLAKNMTIGAVEWTSLAFAELDEHIRL